MTKQLYFLMMQACVLNEDKSKEKTKAKITMLPEFWPVINSPRYRHTSQLLQYNCAHLAKTFVFCNVPVHRLRNSISA